MHSVIIDDIEQKEGRLVISPVTAELLKTIAKWTRFLAIMGFVFIGYFVINAFVAGAYERDTLLSYTTGQDFTPMAGVLINLVAAVIYFFPVLYLFHFSRKIIVALALEDELYMVEAFKYFKRHYKYVGILTIIMLSFYVLILIIGIFVGISQNL